MNIATITTPIGPFTVIASDDEHVLAAGFSVDEEALQAPVHPDLRGEPRRRTDLGSITAAVESYLDGDVTAIDGVPVRQRTNGAFLAEGWAALRDIKAGEPVTYTDLATRLGRPAAVRAAAQACGRNAVGLFVPCHRVIRADRTLGGYRWGLGVKKWLLAHESRMRIV